MDVTANIKYPLQDKGWPVKILIGGVLWLLSFVFIPILPVMGFLYKVLKGTIDQDPALTTNLPEWKDWGELFSKGWNMFLISALYMLIPMALLILGVVIGGGVGYLRYSQDALPGVGIGVLVFLSLLGAALGIVIGFIIPMAMANFAATNRFGAAFRFKEIFGKIKKVMNEYLIAYIIAIVGGVVISLVTSLLPYLGYLLSPFLMFYWSLAVVRMFGEIYIRVK